MIFLAINLHSLRGFSIEWTIYHRFSYEISVQFVDFPAMLDDTRGYCIQLLGKKNYPLVMSKQFWKLANKFSHSIVILKRCVSLPDGISHSTSHKPPFSYGFSYGFPIVWIPHEPRLSESPGADPSDES